MHVLRLNDMAASPSSRMTTMPVAARYFIYITIFSKFSHISLRFSYYITIFDDDTILLAFSPQQY